MNNFEGTMLWEYPKRKTVRGTLEKKLWENTIDGQTLYEKHNIQGCRKKSSQHHFKNYIGSNRY